MLKKCQTYQGFYALRGSVTFMMVCQTFEGMSKYEGLSKLKGYVKIAYESMSNF